MNSTPLFHAAVIAGGRSTRMGRDKAWLRWQGLPLWQHQATTLAELEPARLYIAARTEQEIASTLAEVVHDPQGSDDGPLGAITRLLRLAASPLLVLAVDVPHVTAGFLRTRLLAARTADEGVVLRTGGHFQPLIALYTPAMLPLLEEALASRQLSLQPVIAKAVSQGLMRVVDTTPADESFLLNINTPEDLCVAPAELKRWHADGRSETLQDVTAVEEPLEIRVGGRSVAVVMRTPGHDRELAAGFLVSEGVVRASQELLDITQCAPSAESRGNAVDALLASEQVDWNSLTRHVFSASSCGLCGKTSIDAVFQRFPGVTADWTVTPAFLWSLASRVRAEQATFSRTGGLHAAAIFSIEGDLIALREDVGRHNALDKLLGYGLLRGLLPFDRHVLFLSGRVSFEMMQKALAAGLPLVAAISAPSSLAVQFAQESGQTLVGFLREPTLNVYAHAQRVSLA